MSKRSTNALDYQATRLPIAVMAKDFPAGRPQLPAHRHRRGQLIYAISGVMRIETAAGTWVVPPHRAVWVPPDIEHATRTIGFVAMRTLYVEPRLAKHHRLPSVCCVITVSTLLRELILSAADLPLERTPDARAKRMIGLILDELRAFRVLPLQLPMPSDDEQLRNICRALQRDPSTSRSLDQWSREYNLGSKTLARRFQAQTGLTFGAWRQQACLLEALSRLASGSSVTAVALDLGYESPSAFTAMFKRVTGTAPSRYFDDAGGPRT